MPSATKSISHFLVEEIHTTSTPTLFPTPTYTPLPTFTPYSPQSSDMSKYGVRNWSIDEADFAIRYMTNYLQAIEWNDEYLSVYGHGNYLDTYQYLVLLEKEALLRFPTAQQSETWHWDLAYNLAIVSQFAFDTKSPELSVYARLIEDGLNKGETDFNHLPEWFSNHEERLSLTVIPYLSTAPNKHAYILQLNESAYFWAYQKDNLFKVEGIVSSLFYFRGAYSDYEFLDVTGDGRNELLVKTGIPNCCGISIKNGLYDFSGGHPKELMSIGGDGVGITPLPQGLEGPGFLFEWNVGDPILNPCGLHGYQKYDWDGNRFIVSAEWYEIVPSGKEVCNFAINTAKDPEETKIAVQILSFTGAVSPTDDETLQDLILYQLGEYHARRNNWAKAQNYFDLEISIAETSKKPLSEHQKAAKEFLNQKSSQKSFYQICSGIKTCDIRATMEQAIEDTPSEMYPSIIKTLKKAGIAVLSSGFGDFDDDQFIEQWVVIQHTGKSEREFWILDRLDQKIYGKYVTTKISWKPSVKIYNIRPYETIVQLDGQIFYTTSDSMIDGYATFGIKGPYEEKPDQNKERLPEQILASSEENLLAGQDPAMIRTVLLDFQKSNMLNCKEGEHCMRLLYLLGLSSELSDDHPNASDYYFQLWRNYPESLYAVLARLKLMQMP